MNILDFVKYYSSQPQVISNQSDIKKMKEGGLKDRVISLVERFDEINESRNWIKKLYRQSYIDGREETTLLNENKTRLRKVEDSAKSMLSDSIDLRLVTGNTNNSYKFNFKYIKSLCDETELVFIPKNLVKKSVYGYNTRTWGTSYEELIPDYDVFVLCSFNSIDLKAIIDDSSILEDKFMYLGKFQETFDNLTISLPIIKNLDEGQQLNTILNLDKRLDSITEKSSKSTVGWYGAFQSLGKPSEYLHYIPFTKLKYGPEYQKDLKFTLPEVKVKKESVVSKDPGVEVYQGLEIHINKDKKFYFIDPKTGFKSEKVYDKSSATKSAIRGYLKRNTN